MVYNKDIFCRRTVFNMSKFKKDFQKYVDAEGRQKQYIIDLREKTEHKNEVLITGTVIRKYRPANTHVVVLTIATNGSTGTSNFPSVVWHGKNADTIDESIDPEMKPRVCVTAMAQTTKKTNDAGETKYFQNIVGQSISFAPTVMEAATGKDGIGSPYVPNANAFALIGEIVHKYPFTNGAGKQIGTILTIKTVVGNTFNFQKVTFFGRLLGAVDESEVGGTVCVTGHVETSVSDKSETCRYYETMVGTDFAVI